MAGRENGVQIIVSAGTPALALAVASAAAFTTGGTTVASSAASLSGGTVAAVITRRFSRM